MWTHTSVSRLVTPVLLTARHEGGRAGNGLHSGVMSPNGYEAQIPRHARGPGAGGFAYEQTGSGKNVGTR